MVMFDTLSRRFLSSYGNTWVKTPNFDRLKEKTVQFNSFYACSLPCMPARRELHTGRPNFLHRSWGPIEPYDFSCFEELKKNHIYTHIVTDHSHYWEDGGATYMPRYSTWEGFRGQEGDRWVGIVNSRDRLDIPQQAPTTKSGESFYFNHANRTRMVKEEDFSSVTTMQAGLEFIEKNHDEDNWFLQIESFDPHEPFYVPDRYLDLYDFQDDDVVFEWPAYAPVCESEALKKQIILRYAALISMCDNYLGKVLDAFDQFDLWKDTMLIVNTDHGFLMGEHEWWGKNVQPAYNEIVQLPFYLYDPRQPEEKGEREALATTIDIPATLLSFFGVELPESMLGRDLAPVLRSDEKIHDAVLFGSFGGHVNVCDGRYVYMRAAESMDNQPLYEYTMMPTRMRNFFEAKNLQKAELDTSFACFQHYPVLKVPARAMFSSYRYGHRLYDIRKDPYQRNLLDDMDTEIKMIEKMRCLMNACECPDEQYVRIGIPKDRKMTKQMLLAQREARRKGDELPIDLPLSLGDKRRLLQAGDFLPEELREKLFEAISQQFGQCSVMEIITEFMSQTVGKKKPTNMVNMLLGIINAAANNE